MPEGQSFDIPESGFKWFKEKMSKLDAKSKKLVGEGITVMVIGKHPEEDSTGRKLSRMIFEVFVAMPEIKLSGWEFIARIDHSQDLGNVVRIVPGKTLPEKYRNSSNLLCEHCFERRQRRDTFVLRCSDTDEHKQVGSSCLKDFLGHGDAARWAKLAELVSQIEGLARGSHGFAGNQDYRYYDTRRFCAYAARAVLKDGFYVSKKNAEAWGRASTSNIAWDMYSYDTDDLIQDEISLADRALAWAQDFEKENTDNLNDWEHNALVIANSDALEPRHTGIAASIVGVYFAKFEKPIREPKQDSNHVGTIGTKIKVKGTLKDVVQGEFSTRHVFIDDEGNVFMWFATNKSFHELKGKRVEFEGTLKNHTEYKNVKQNLINRVKIKEI